MVSHLKSRERRGTTDMVSTYWSTTYIPIGVSCNKHNPKRLRTLHYIGVFIEIH